MDSILWFVLSVLIVFIVSALPLHLSVKLFNGKTHLIKSGVVNVLIALMAIIISLLIPFGSLIAFLLLILIYRELFRLSLLRSVFVWLFQMVFVFVFVLIFSIAGVAFPLMKLVI